jgi:hypothetical protein
MLTPQNESTLLRSSPDGEESISTLTTTSPEVTSVSSANKGGGVDWVDHQLSDAATIIQLREVS